MMADAMHQLCHLCQGLPFLLHEPSECEGLSCRYTQQFRGRAEEVLSHSEAYRHHADVESLERSAKMGCHLCTLLLDPVQEAFARSRFGKELLGTSLIIFMSAYNLQVMHDDFEQPVTFDLIPESEFAARRQPSTSEAATRILYMVELITPYGVDWKYPYRKGKRSITYKNREVFDVLAERDALLLVKRHGRIRAEKAWLPRLLLYRIEEPIRPLFTRVPPWEQQDQVWSAEFPIGSGIPDIDLEPLTKKSTAQIHQWITTCEKFHTRTNCSKSNPKLPPRVIYVGTSSNPCLRLMITSRQSAKYVTLSYRWGSSNNYKLKNDNILKLQNEILPEQLPRTILDAITITRRLKYQYIWIDALCIIQDSDKDWREQSSLFAEIYADAALNISTDRAQEADSGCLQPRNPLQIRSCLLPISARAPSQSARMAVVPQATNGWSKYTLGPLSRGWIFQERLFSRRILHVGDVEFSWTCHEGVASEANPIIATQLWTNPYVCKVDVHADWPPMLRFDMAYSRRIRWCLNEWYISIELFTTTQFTRRSDILPAVAAFAATYGRWLPTSSRYIAGIWNVDFPAGLAWQVVKPTARDKYYVSAVSRRLRHGVDADDVSAGRYRQNKVQYIAPSFSWASLDSPVRHDHRDESYELDEKSFICSYLSDVKPLRLVNYKLSCRPGPFGQVTDGWITVRGKFISYSAFLKSKQFQQRQHDCYDLIFDNDQLKSPPEGLVLLLLHVKIRDEGAGSVWEALALGSTCSTANEYQRIGLFVVDDKKHIGYKIEEVDGDYKRIAASTKEADPYTEAYFADWTEGVLKIV